MTRDRATLELVGVSLHGRDWKAPLADNLGVDLRTLQRWANGRFDIPNGVWRDIADLLRKRSQVLGLLANNLESIPEVSDSPPIRIIDRGGPQEFTPNPERDDYNQRIPKLGTRWEGVDPKDWLEPFSWQGDYVWVHTMHGDRLYQSDEFWDWVQLAHATMKPIPEPPKRCTSR